MENKRVVIIDGDALLYICTAGNKILDEVGEPIKIDNKFTYNPKTLEEVYKSVDEILLSILSKVNCFNYIGFLGNGSNFRYKIYPDYKKNRLGLIKPEFFKECKQYLVDKYNFNLCDDVESDDNVLITRKILKKDYKTLIVTGDKDLIKCTPGNFFNINNYEIVYTNEEQAELNFWKSVICGDNSDNIPGIKGRGIKYTEKLFISKEQYGESKLNIVFNEYIEHFGEYIGIQEFYKNYMCLRLIEEKEDFILPEIQEFKI